MNKIFCWFRNDILKTINYKKKIFPAVVINILCTHQSAATHKVSVQECLSVFTWSFHYKYFFIRNYLWISDLRLTLPIFELQDLFCGQNNWSCHCKYLNARFECNDIVIFIYCHYPLDPNAKSSDTKGKTFSIR